MSCVTEILDTPQRCQAIADEWEALFGRCPRAAVPLSPAWMLAWWKVYAKQYATRQQGMVVICVRRDGILIGVLPLYRRRRRVRFGPSPDELYLLSSGEAEFEETCAEYLDLLCRDEDAADCLAAIATALRSLRWHRIALCMLDRRSSLPALGEQLTDVAEIETRAVGPCLIADLRGGFDAWMQRLSSSRRYRLRQVLRHADEDWIRLELADVDNAGAAFDTLGDLHQRRWTEAGSPGCFAAPRWVAFHRHIIASMLPSGRAVLATLHVHDQVVAALYGFIAHDTFHYYQSGVQREKVAGVDSPGKLAILLLMRRLAAQGVSYYDFLHGMSDYKRQLSTSEGGLIEVVLWRRSFAGRCWRRIHPWWLRVMRKLRLIDA